MIPFTYQRVVPMVFLLVLSGLMLAVVPVQHAVPALAETRSAKSSPAVYALLHVGKQLKGWSTEMYREDAYRKVTANMFHSPGIHGEALRESGIASLRIVKEQKKPKDWLDKHINTEYFDNTPILRVSLTVGTPDEQVAILNAVMRAYLRSVEEDRKTAMHFLEFQKQNLALCIRRMRTLEYELVAMNDIEARDLAEAERYAYYRNVKATELAQLKEGTTTTFPRRIKEWQDRLRNIPRLLDWAEKPEPAE